MSAGALRAAQVHCAGGEQDLDGPFGREAARVENEREPSCDVDAVERSQATNARGLVALDWSAIEIPAEPWG
jgi:hypothetical protein